VNNVILYCITVLIWGTTWFAIKLQVGHAPNEISIFYRAALATICLFAWCKIKGLSLRFNPKDHIFLCLLGLAMFSLHYVFVYHATNYIVSGVVAVVFAGVSFLSILNNFIFFRIKPSLNIIVGALVGASGLCVFFWHEVTSVTLQKTTLKGLLLAGIGTLIFSIGSSITKRNHNKGLALIPSMTMGMAYGTLAMLFYTIAQANQFILPDSPLYWASLFYLVILGSIVAFLCYLTLIKNIGPELAGYTTILFPIVALIVSWALEGYQGSIADIIGLSLVMCGNILVMTKKPLISSFSRKAAL
jgi:drug/metabolite transporter (DMT)-like permease